MTSVLEVLFPPSLGRPKATARAEMAEQSMTTALGCPVRITVAENYSELVSKTLAGNVDLVWAPAGVCAQLSSVALRVFQVVRAGRTHYRSALVVSTSSKLELSTLRQARNLRAAWVDPHSLGGYLLAMELLRRHGVQPPLVFSQQLFLGSHPEALAAVSDGRADLAAVTAWTGEDQDARSAVAMHIGPLENRLAILAITDEAPTDALILCKGVDPVVVKAMEELLAAHSKERLTERPPSLGAKSPAIRSASSVHGGDAGVRNKSFLAVAMGADRYIESSIDVYLQLQRRLLQSAAQW